MGLTEIKGYKNEDPILEGFFTDPKVLLLLLCIMTINFYLIYL